MLEQPVGVFDERFERREVGVDLFPAPVDPVRDRLLPDLEVSRASCGSSADEDVVERHRRFDVGVGELAVVGQDTGPSGPCGISCT